LGGIGALGLTAATGLWNVRPGHAADLADWSLPPDLAKAKEEALHYTTYGMPDSWANYGEVLEKLAKHYGFTIEHNDTDMSSLEEITKFDAEKANPMAISADIGILFGAVADQKGVVPPYMPPNAAKLSAGLKGAKGGWVATFTGVPAFAVNTEIVKNVPRRWADLVKPEYKGMINVIDASGGGGTDVASFIAWAYAMGGNENDLGPAIDFARKMMGQYASASANTQTLEKGEVPIQIRYDFNCIASANQLKGKGVPVEVVIPGDGSIYAPSALMINKYNVAKMNIAKLMLNFVLSDEGQAAFARFGARPIRWVLGDLDLPADAKSNWLPDEQYKPVQNLADWSKVDLRHIAGVWAEEVSAG